MLSQEVMHYVYLVAWIAAAINLLLVIANGILLRKIRKLRAGLDSLLEEATRCNNQSKEQLAALKFAAEHFCDPNEAYRLMQENQIKH